MKLNKLTPRELSQLQAHIRGKTPSFYFSSQTSTVIPYDRIEEVLQEQGVEEFSLVNLSELPKSMHLDEENRLHVIGPVCWKEAKAFCHSKGRDIKTSPTEELASILAGFATSATGERCFGFGTLRDQVRELEYINHLGEISRLSAESLLAANDDLLKYQESYDKFKAFKNAPFPRLEKETDLLIGTEGQLGVITSALLETTPLEARSYIFIKLPRWEEDYQSHLEVFERVQSFRDRIYSCELLDSNSMDVLPPDERVVDEGDIIFLEVKSAAFENVYEDLISKFTTICEEDIFEVPAAKCAELRMNVPRYTFERNSRMGVVKKGTDIQVEAKDFKNLLDLYRKFSGLGIDYNLFGHFGDGHLHFNFLPDKSLVDTCQQKLEELYDQMSELRASPFAEHGIGIIKQKFIKKFLNKTHYRMFKVLKEEHDPENIFFPNGFLSLRE
ncbi:putative dehydrogenase [Halobacteriovorax marinus SJ]|uniref:D-lactate dehydrogenase (cytochrome) n=1 Tax=Halobacteriovorax marinus (strain ATCC BAA-682 / DSM 15412 / SJ) TaxID=862908 RepID=E1X586_HALMS|nr:FAD-binding oxidoreductase [Halobacteriovorax marinus]CBW25558.1 putative dehydrogenase [Halobacteriovorax marinus SJ]